MPSTQWVDITSLTPSASIATTIVIFTARKAMRVSLATKGAVEIVRALAKKTTYSWTKPDNFLASSELLYPTIKLSAIMKISAFGAKS